MKITMMGFEKAESYVPTVKTYMIRIFDGINYPESITFIHYGDLVLSELFVEKRYVFDDLQLDKILEVAPDYNWKEDGAVYFDIEIAKRIIEDFIEEGKDCLEMIVHCTFGLFRSPAVAMSLNEIFDLGNDFEERKASGVYNAYVLMHEAAKELNI